MVARPQATARSQVRGGTQLAWLWQRPSVNVGGAGARAVAAHMARRPLLISVTSCACFFSAGTLAVNLKGSHRLRPTQWGSFSGTASKAGT